ncbi:type 1 fimbrial protein [Aeromonas salmonicida subsp. salmonicida]|nr:type 1 fimbrial protein [Aeromonas salmonicida subsp. salmonicida]
MKNTIISAAMLLSFSVIGMNANAAEIQFSGAVTATSCTLEKGGNMIMQLPTFGINDVAEVGQHSGVTTVSAVATCPSATEDGLVTMSMVPNQSSFEGKVLKNTYIGGDAAKGVGIVVMGDDRQPLDFLDTAAKITAPMTGGVANIVVSATYAKDGSGAEVEAGKVAAVLPFVMTYE